MERKYLILSLLTVFAILTASCGREDQPAYQDGQGGVEFSISSQWTDTKSDARDANISINDFKVELINSAGVIFKRWKKYSDYASQEDKTVLLNAGSSYTLRATYGDSTAVGFDAFFFMGDTTFIVPPQQTVTMDVLCKQANVEVAVTYGDVLKTEYTDYHATVKHKRTRDSLVFAAATTESGYIREGELDLYVYVTDSDGVPRRFGTKTPYIAAAGDSITFNINTKPTPTYELAFDITINSATLDTVINVPIDAYMLSQDAPKIVPEGFNVNTGILSYIEGTKPSAAAVNINAQSGIKSCVMKINSAYLKSIGWPDEVDFFNIPTDVKNIMNRDGLLWTSDMTGLTLANVDFKNVAKILRYTDAASADNTFTFTVIDNSEYEKTVTASYILNITEATVGISDIADVDVWSSSFPMVLTTNGDPSLLCPQVKAGTGSWITPAYTSSTSRNIVTMQITGLTPGTSYSVRGAYYDHRSEEKAASTEYATQLGNPGFEDFYYVASTYTFKWVISYTNDKIVFYPWAQGDEANKWWDTNNAATTAGAGTPGYQWAKCFPTVNYTETSVHGGSKAAQVRSVAVNDYNSAVATTGGKTQGKLFCNHSFASRPTKIEFYYKYESYNNDTYSATIELKNGDAVIANGSFTQSSSVSGWTLASVDLSYSDLKKKATSIVVTFLSSTNTEPDVQIQALTILGKEYSTTHTGSCITLDDINLVYGK